MLDLLGLGDCLHRRPDQMSGGEQQRAAIAVALVNEPKVLLADEPTGELDTATAAEVFGALQRANTELGVTVLIVTHDPAVSSVVRRVVAIRDGRTSTEIHRRATTGDDGEVAQHAVEYAVLDRAGRLQLPREMTEPLGMRDLVRLEAEPDHIGVWPDRRETAMSAVVATDMLAVTDVVRTFGSGRTATRALRGVSFGVRAGQLVALRGRSGSGKTTLLNIVGGLDRPDSGQVRVGDRDVTAMSGHERMELRRSSVAFIFQSFGLIPILSAAENVGVPLRIAGMAPKEREERVRLMLDIVGLGEHARATAGRAVRRPAAAGRDRAGAGRPPAGAAGRRAHRPARLGDGEADHAAAAHRGAVRGGDRPGRHPRPRPHRHRRLRPGTRGRNDQERLIPNGPGDLPRAGTGRLERQVTGVPVVAVRSA